MLCGLFCSDIIDILSNASDYIPYIFYLDLKISAFSGIFIHKLIEKKLVFLNPYLLYLHIFLYPALLSYQPSPNLVNVALELIGDSLKLFSHIVAQVLMIVFDVVEDVLMLQKSFVDGASNLSNERLDVFFSLILICTERGLCLCMLYVSELMRNGEYFLFQ